MELSFQTTPLRFLKRIAREIRYQEETADTIVPDSYPDIATISDCYAEAILRGKDCRSGAVILSGGIKAAILYEQEGAALPRKLELYIPFTTKFDHPQLSDLSQVICTVRVRSVDARVINSRKAMLRVNLGCEMTAYEDTDDQTYSLQSKPDMLQIKESIFDIRLPMETGERSFVVHDTLELPAGLPAIQELYKVKCHADVSDRKLVGNKGVFKGTLHCKFAYLSEDSNLYVWEQQLPYSQYCEFKHDYEECSLEVFPVITGYDVEPEAGIDQHQISITIHILAQCIVSGNSTMHIIEDAFSTKGTLRSEWKSYQLQGEIDRQSVSKPVRHSAAAQLREIFDTDVYLDYAEEKRLHDSCQITIPLYIRVLGLDTDGRICSVVSKTEAIQEFALCSQADAVITSLTASDISASLSGSQLDLVCNVSLHANFFADQQFGTLCAGEIIAPDTAVKRPSVVLRVSGTQDTLWSISKKFGSSVETVQQANHLESDQIPAGMMLLIPIGS